jgi:FtsZ-binding cell division protein ZapB
MNIKELSKEKLGFIHRPFHQLNAEVEQLKESMMLLQVEITFLKSEVERLNTRTQTLSRGNVELY